MAERDFSAKLAGKFVDDDDLVRTGRAWVEIDGFDFLHIPVPTGFDETMNVFEAQAKQVSKDAETSGKYASAAKSSASSAASSASKAAGSEGRASSDAKKAQDGASRAETAAGNAKTSETNAEDAARRASNSSTSANRSSVWVSEAEQRTKKSASDAADSAKSAKADADRAANIASSTSWKGDRLTVNGKTSPSLTGPKGNQGERGPKGTVEPGEVVPLPNARVDITSSLNSKDGAGKGTLMVQGGTCFLSLEYTPNKTGTIYLISGDSPLSEYAPAEWVYATVASTDDKDTCLVTFTGSRLSMSGVSSAGSLYRISMMWTIAGDVSAMSGPMGPPGEVTKAQLDTAIASEQARTVGVTWTVPRETDVAAKARVAQVGDYIQVAQSHTIYRVTSGGVEVERYGTRTLQASTDSTSNRNPNQWLDNDDPWAGVNWSRVSPPAGKWLIELINPHDFDADLYVEGSKVTTVTSGTAAYTTEFSTAAKSDVYVKIPGDNHYKPITLRFTPIN